MTATQLKSNVDQLFGHFQKGEWDEAAKLFSKDARLTQHFGPDIKTVDLETFMQSAKHGPLSKVGHPVYLERKVQLMGTTGFAEQHITRLTIGETVLNIPVCLIGQFDATGLITTLEEYLDPTKIMKAMMT